MERTKRVVISLCAALIIVFVSNFIMVKLTSKETLLVPIINTDLRKGDSVKANVSWIEFENSDLTRKLYKDKVAVEDLNENSVINIEVEKGQALFKSMIGINDSEVETSNNKDLELIAIPIRGAEYSVGYKIKKKDRVTIYYTSKFKLVNAVINNKEKIFGSNSQEAMVTCKLLEDVDIKFVKSSSEDNNSDSIINIVIEVNKKDAMLIANLKDQGVFDIALCN